MDNLVLHYYYFSNSRPWHCTNMAITNVPFIIMFLSWWKSWLTPSWSWSSWHKVVTPHCVSVPVCVPVPRTACHTVARLQSWWWRCACPEFQWITAGKSQSKCVTRSQWLSVTPWQERFQGRFVSWRWRWRWQESFWGISSFDFLRCAPKLLFLHIPTVLTIQSLSTENREVFSMKLWVAALFISSPLCLA